MKYFRDIAFGSNEAIEYARKLENDCDKYLDIIQAKNLEESFLKSEIELLKERLSYEVAVIDSAANDEIRKLNKQLDTAKELLRMYIILDDTEMYETTFRAREFLKGV